MKNTYDKILDQYSIRSNSHRVHLKSDARSFNSIAADREADLKISGNYNTSKSNICPDCFITRYVNGSCNCS